jgi:hypothetical protein
MVAWLVLCIDCQIRLHNVANVKSVKFMGRIINDDSHGISSIANRAQLTLRSHSQIANLAIEITPAGGFDVVWTAWTLVVTAASKMIRSAL